jgi:hypothetical protein
MEQYMMVNGSLDFDMEKENKYGRMAVIMKGIGGTIKHMGKED